MTWVRIPVLRQARLAAQSVQKFGSIRRRLLSSAPHEDALLGAPAPPISSRLFSALARLWQIERACGGLKKVDFYEARPTIVDVLDKSRTSKHSRPAL